METPVYDIAIAGGGLAGLALSIQMSRSGYSVILFEKEQYPFHRVCGEYISNESKSFLQDLGVPLDEMRLPSIRKVLLTSVNGRSVEADLPLGGFGISRYKLDDLLSKLAKNEGVRVYESTRVNDISYQDDHFTVHVQHTGSESTFRAKACCAAFGKRSHLDVKWNRSFLRKQDKRLDNYLGVKYHIHTDWNENLIGLHNFKNGYCGISKIEDDTYCLCYMTKAEEVKKYHGNLSDYEKDVLSANPFISDIFSKSRVLPGFPVTIAQINFQKKSLVENNVIMIGDAAGMITPLCGNGMSIAFHSSRIAAELLRRFLDGDVSYTGMQKLYVRRWKKEFSRRMTAGRALQRLFGRTGRSNRFVQLLRLLPFLRRPLIRLTHGRPF